MTLTFDPSEGMLFQKLYETFNSCPTWTGDTAKGPARDKRNGEILDSFDAATELDEAASPWFQVGYARKFHKDNLVTTVVLTKEQHAALKECLLAGAGMWLPTTQKLYIRPLLAKFNDDNT